MAKITFDMEEIRDVMTKYGETKFGITADEDSYFMCDDASDVVSDVQFVIELKPGVVIKKTRV
jgi:hypothetical protein